MKLDSALLEIGTEPLPARFVPGTLAQMEAKVKEHLSEARLPFASVRAVGTLRRQALLIDGVPPKTESLKKTVSGPPVKLLKDAQGGYTPQAVGFAKAQGTTPDKLITVDSPRGPLMAAEVVLPGEKAEKLLGPIFKKVVESLVFPKSMVWEETGFRYGRPIRSFAAFYGAKAVSFEVAGVRAGKTSLPVSEASPKPLPLKGAATYIKELSQKDISVDPLARRSDLVLELQRAAKQAGATPDLDEALVSETVYLTERPVAAVCSFREDFLQLPEDLLVTVLKTQLKAYPLRRGGALAQSFIAVRDGSPENMKEVVDGFQRVVTARFEDAVFYFGRDKAKGLEAMRESLKDRLYQKGLGTVHDKAERVKTLALRLAESVEDDGLDAQAVTETARLAYADLASEVVGSFPELQGRIGGAYARAEGRSERVALGLQEFYRPEAAKSPVPTTLEGSLASLAGKLDTLAGDFCLGAIPSGSEDPRGLRRQALGAFRIALEKGMNVSLSRGLEWALELQPTQPEDKKKVLAQLEDFVWQRAESFLEEAGYKADELKAVREGALGDVPRAVKRLAALHAVRVQPEFASLAAAFKRASNILKQAGLQAGNGHVPEADPALFADDAEAALHEALQSMDESVRDGLADGDFEGSLKRMTALKSPVDGFFEKVLVNAPEEAVRKNRYALLARLVRLFKSVADLSQLQG